MLAATAIGCAPCAFAQDAGELRGSPAIDATSLRGSSPNTAPPVGSAVTSGSSGPAYVPASAGALADAPAGVFSAEADENVEVRKAAPATARALLPSQAPAATEREGTVDSEDDLALDAGAEREQAIEAIDPAEESEPYAATGVRLGTFVLKPTIETGITATSNADSTSTGGSAMLSETTLRLTVASDWSSHAAALEGFVTVRESLSGEEVSDVEGGLNGDAAFDLGKEYRLVGGVELLLRPVSAASPVALAGVASQPLHSSLSGELGLEKKLGKARFAVTGSVGHDRYEDAELEGGGTLSQEDRNSFSYGLTLRTGYELSPALTPFVEAEIGRRDYLLDTDSAGYARSSDLTAARAGLGIDLGEKLSGEISAGWLRERFDDERLDAISAPSLEADLAWSPWRGTILGLAASTEVEGATDAGESGSVLYSGRLTAERQLRSNLTGRTLLGFSWRDYAGSEARDLILDAEASLTWWLNRYAGLTTRVRHERVESTLADRDSETNSIFIGLKLQR